MIEHGRGTTEESINVTLAPESTRDRQWNSGIGKSDLTGAIHGRADRANPSRRYGGGWIGLVGRRQGRILRCTVERDPWGGKNGRGKRNSLRYGTNMCII